MKNNAYIMTVLESICPHNHSRSGLAVTHLLGEGLVTDDMKNQDQSSKVVLLQSQTQGLLLCMYRGWEEAILA